MNLKAALAHPELNPWEGSRQGRILETFEIDSWELEMARNLVENCVGSREDHRQYLISAHSDYIHALRVIRQQTKPNPNPSIVEKIQIAEDERAAVAQRFQGEMRAERNKTPLSSSERRMLAKARKKKASNEFKESKACAYVKAGIEVGIGAACGYVGGPWLGAGCAIGAAGALDNLCQPEASEQSSTSTTNQ